jgi:hypothetical protein
MEDKHLGCLGRRASRLSTLEQETSRMLACRDKRGAHLPSERGEILETACPQAVFRFLCRPNGMRGHTVSNPAGLLRFARGSQFAVEEFGSGAVGPNPIAPPEKVVNFVGDD